MFDGEGMSKEVFFLLILGLPLAYSLIKHFLNLHYKSSGKQKSITAGASTEDIEDLLVQAKNMEDRIMALEHILDNDLPGWRGRSRT